MNKRKSIHFVNNDYEIYMVNFDKKNVWCVARFSAIYLNFFKFSLYTQKGAALYFH